MRRRTSLGLLPFVLLAGCPQPAPSDAGDARVDTATDTPTDTPADIGPDTGNCNVTDAYINSVHPGTIFVRTGATVDTLVRMSLDRQCPITLNIQVIDPTRATAPATVTVNTRESVASFSVTGVAPGRTRLRVSKTNATSAMGEQVEVDVVVQDAVLPACPAGTTVAGSLAPGQEIKGAANTPLADARVALPAALTVTPVAGTIRCATALPLPTGYTAIGPAVTFTPESTRYVREVQVELPIVAALVPPMYELYTEVLYTGPGITPRIVPVTNKRFTTSGNALGFTTARLGTFQAVMKSDLGHHMVRKHVVYRALLGVSMGAIGTSMVGTRHPDKFDVLAPLGGPLEWGWFGDYIRQYPLGGFCTEQQRATLGTACDRASFDRIPPFTDAWVPRQHFEFFHSGDDAEGQGGSFDRGAYVRIFKDLTYAFGNAIVDSDPANHVLPLGVPATELTRSDEDRCANPVVKSNYCDDEYNPTGAYPVITFCDGNHTAEHDGEWAGPPGNTPLQISFAVDRNRNNVRDFGEPVIRNFSEPYSDLGPDGIASAAEPGYSPTNPDPAGDDYDRVFNPAGTEGNRVHDTGEPYSDVGLDGVAAAGNCAADTGEGNNQFDLAYGAQNVLRNNGRRIYAEDFTPEQAHNMAIWADGGTRDLLGLGASAHHWMSAVAQRNESLHVFNNYSPIVAYRPFPANNDTGYDFKLPDYKHLPNHVLMRYGFEDATPEQILAGDGGHVGDTGQALNRIYTAMYWAASRWPGGNNDTGSMDASRDDATRCQNGVLCTFNFQGPTSNRLGPVSIALPPGYHAAGNTDRYPVIYVLHGYGMDAASLLAVGPLLGNAMVSTRTPRWQRPQKFILVFVDGRCRGTDGCVSGTFYGDSPTPGNAQGEKFLLDVYDYVEQNFRVKLPEDIDVME